MPEQIDLRSAGNGEELANLAAALFVEKLETFESPLVTLPTGATPLGMYHALTTHHAHRRDLWEKMRFLALDEYLGLRRDDPRLFYGWLRREFLDRVGIPESRCTAFQSDAADPRAEAERIKAWLRQNGPIDIAVLGLGTNGHIAFNEPGSAFDSTVRTVTLTENSRKANAAYWGDIALVPETALTLGLGDLSWARHSILLVSGAHKAAILDRVLNGPVTPAVPATYLRGRANVTVIADKDALAPLL